MAVLLPPHYLELVADASLKSYWRRQALRDFLRRSGISQGFPASWAPEETKRDLLNRLFPRLEASGDSGVRLINRMADSLVQQTSFPDLEGWEDSAEKKKNAARAIEALRAYRQQQAEQAQEKHERAATRKRVEAIQQETKKKALDLQKLSDRLAELSRCIGTQKAGYDFQDWFYDLVDFFEILNRRPYVTGGRQIDGSVTVDGTTYLIELKFTREQTDAPEIDTFHKKVTTKADNTMGIMLSITGFTSTAIREASGPKTPLLLLDHAHIYMLLQGIRTFEEVIGRVRRHSSQTGEAYLRVEDF